MNLLRLIRFPNLVIVALTQYFFYFLVLLPAFELYDIQPTLHTRAFHLYVAVTLIVTATGYLINDLLDLPADRINRPDRLLVSGRVTPQIASWLYGIGSIFGFIASFYLGITHHRAPLILIYPLAVGLLVWYSAYLKKIPLTGNLLIALFCAGVAGVVWLAEWHSLEMLAQQAPRLASRVKALFVWYMVFAFLITLYREIVKDLEDLSGDRGAGFRTLPLVYGATVAKYFALAAGVLLLCFLIYEGFYFKNLYGLPMVAFMILTVVLPLLASFPQLVAAQQPEAYRRVSLLLKAVMLFGILLLLFTRF